MPLESLLRKVQDAFSGKPQKKKLSAKLTSKKRTHRVFSSFWVSGRPCQECYTLARMLNLPKNAGM